MYKRQLLLLGLEPLPGYEFRGSKIFGYLKAGRPIIGVLPLDETKKILHRVGVSTDADIDSPSEIVNVLRELLDAWSAGTLASLVPDRAACKVYSAEQQTELLVRALTGMRPLNQWTPSSGQISASLQGDIGP